jgi:nicotinamide phosphoribosyltransferase
MKNSAKGLLAVHKNSQGEFYMVEQTTWDDVFHCEYVKVFEDGKLLVDEKLETIRKRLGN